MSGALPRTVRKELYEKTERTMQKNLYDRKNTEKLIG